MSPDVTQEEIEALLEQLRPLARSKPLPADVRERDFEVPSRLGARKLVQLRERLAGTLTAIRRGLATSLRGAVELDLADVVEVDVGKRLDELEPPFAVVRFRVAGEPGWIVWELEGAIAAIEIALGATDTEETEERALSAVERGMLRELLEPLLSELTRSIGLTPSDLSVCEGLEDLGSWREAGDRADPQRLALQLRFEGPGGESTLRTYLPGVVPGRGEGQTPAPDAPLPANLREVPVDVSARLGAADIPLSELLAIEPGDVVPLGVPDDELVTLWVEDRPCARARLGSHLGMLAVHIDHFERPDDED